MMQGFEWNLWMKDGDSDKSIQAYIIPTWCPRQAPLLLRLLRNRQSRRRQQRIRFVVAGTGGGVPEIAHGGRAWQERLAVVWHPELILSRTRYRLSGVAGGAGGEALPRSAAAARHGRHAARISFASAHACAHASIWRLLRLEFELASVLLMPRAN